MTKEQLKEEAYNTIVDIKKYDSVGSIPPIIKNFIDSQIDKAYEEGKKEGIEDLKKQIAPDFNLLKIQIETLKHLTK